MSTKYTKGFTLIELVVVLGILVGLGGTLLLQGSGARDRMKVQRAAVQLKAAIIEAQALGNSGRIFTPEGVPYDEKLDYDRGYGIYVEEGDDFITMYGGDGDGTGPNDEVYDVDNTYEVVTFESGVEVDDVSVGGNRVQIFFRRGESGALIFKTNSSVLQSNVTITLALNDASAKVFVNEAGLVYIEE